MGGVVARLWSPKRSFRDHLEYLEQEIRRLESAQQRSAIIRRQLISSIVLWSSVLYVATFASYILVFLPPGWPERFLYGAPFLFAPLLILLLNKYLNLFLEKRYHNYGVKLNELKGERKKVLEEVMENESYKNAKELLERFDPDSTFLQPAQLNASVAGTPLRNFGAGTPIAPPGSNLRQRRRPLQDEGPMTPSRPIAAATPQPRSLTPPKRPVKPQQKVTATPLKPPKVMSSSSTQTTPFKGDKKIPTGVANRSPQVQIVREYLLPGHVKNERAGGPPVSQQILPAQRTSVDKFVEFVIGDGPNNRYALICSQCHSHNGMALPEDYEYMSFRCAYCYTVNPARRNTPLSAGNTYKLPNLQVKPPTIVKEIAASPEPTAAESDTENMCSSVHETPEKDVTELLEDGQEGGDEEEEMVAADE